MQSTTYICNCKPKRVQPGRFGGQPARADPEIIVSGGGGGGGYPSLTDVLVVLY